jgi:PIN domain nuclease of toxin-antitoxin system
VTAAGVAAYVLDASAMIAFLRQERGWQVAETALSDPSHACLAHAVNMCEVFYHFHRAGGEPAAQTAVGILLGAYNVGLREDLDLPFWQVVGRQRSVYRQMSFGDCSCLALALRLGASVVTADHPDFDPITAAGACPVLIIR